METLLHENTWARTELKATPPDPCMSPKSLPPIVRAAPTGPEVDESDEIVGAAGSTVREVLAVTPDKVAMIVLLPAPTAVTKPGVELLTTATGVLEELHIAEAVRSAVLPSVYVPLTENCRVCPARTYEDGGVMVRK